MLAGVSVSVWEWKPNQNLQVYKLVESEVCLEWMRRPKKPALKEPEIHHSLRILHVLIKHSFHYSVKLRYLKADTIATKKKLAKNIIGHCFLQFIFFTSDLLVLNKFSKWDILKTTVRELYHCIWVQVCNYRHQSKSYLHNHNLYFIRNADQVFYMYAIFTYSQTTFWRLYFKITSQFTYVNSYLP